MRYVLTRTRLILVGALVAAAAAMAAVSALAPTAAHATAPTGCKYTNVQTHFNAGVQSSDVVLYASEYWCYKQDSQAWNVFYMAQPRLTSHVPSLLSGMWDYKGPSQAPAMQCYGGYIGNYYTSRKSCTVTVDGQYELGNYGVTLQRTSLWIQMQLFYDGSARCRTSTRGWYLCAPAGQGT